MKRHIYISIILRQHSQGDHQFIRDTIWVLNKENITITGLSDRFKNYTRGAATQLPRYQYQHQRANRRRYCYSIAQGILIFSALCRSMGTTALKHSNAKISASLHSQQ